MTTNRQLNQSGPTERHNDTTYLTQRFDYDSAFRAWHWAALRVEAVEKLVRQTVSETGLIGEAAAYHLNSGGKKFRPLFLLAMSHAVGAPESAALQTAAACEVLHNASLIHDDLQDNDQTRRGREAVWWRYGKNTAINLGDYFIASTYRLLADLDCPDAVRTRLTRLFSETIRKVIVGQAEELTATGQLDLTVTDYERIARRKSGMLLALPVNCALTFTAASASQQALAGSAMQWLGVAYQIQDDLLDLLGLKENRPAGVDIRERRASLPVILFYKGLSDPDTRQAFSRFFESDDKAAADAGVDNWVAAIRNSDSVDRCIARLAVALDRVSDRLNHLPVDLQSVIRAGQTKMFRNVNRILQSQTELEAAQEQI